MSGHIEVQLYLWADDCGHPEPDDETETSPEWHDWDARHPYSDEAERICIDTPLPVKVCPECSDNAGEEMPCQLTKKTGDQ